jgi:hypothetical protein
VSFIFAPVFKQVILNDFAGDQTSLEGVFSLAGETTQIAWGLKSTDFATCPIFNDN